MEECFETKLKSHSAQVLWASVSWSQNSMLLQVQACCPNGNPAAPNPTGQNNSSHCNK